MSNEFFPKHPDAKPVIHAYKILGAENRDGLLKVGYTTRNAKQRVKEQLQTSGLKYKIVLEASAVRNDGTAFSDHEVHRALAEMGFTRVDGEWFACTADKVKVAIITVRERKTMEHDRSLDFAMRPEQLAAVEKTASYLQQMSMGRPDRPPHFLWNAKMRFGKTFASYQLAKIMVWKKIPVQILGVTSLGLF